MTAAAWPPAGLHEWCMALPWEYRLRGISPDAARARWSMEASTAQATADLPRIGLLLDARDTGRRGTGNDACEDWLRTIAGWSTQTAPTAGWWVIGAAEEPWRAERQAAGLPAPTGCISEAGPALPGVDWALAAVAGDLLHPSLAWVIANAAMDGAPAACWDWMDYDESRDAFSLRTRHRAPWRDMVRELHEDVRGRAFAAPIAAWDGFPIASAWKSRMAIAIDAGAPGACLHPEPLAMYRHGSSGQGRVESTHALRAVERHWKAPFTRRDDGMLQPAQPVSSVSVVVMYRDRPELTIAAMRSVLAQQVPGELELVLVDNNSTASTARMIDEFLAQQPPGIRITHLHAPGAFNHSAQAAMAADAAWGEVLLWLNNDARLLQADAIDQLSRWARLPGVASVGAAVEDASGTVIGGGMLARRTPGPEFNSPVEEARGEAATHSRETIGNSFACAAVSAHAWRALGGLDARRFPAGYNDVDYCLRAAAQGWTHINLAQVRIHHAVGASRPKLDEIAQKTWLRSQHPWVAARALAEPLRESLDLVVPALPVLRAASTHVGPGSRLVAGHADCLGAA